SFWLSGAPPTTNVIAVPPAARLRLASVCWPGRRSVIEWFRLASTVQPVGGIVLMLSLSKSPLTHTPCSAVPVVGGGPEGSPQAATANTKNARCLWVTDAVSAVGCQP